MAVGAPLAKCAVFLGGVCLITYSIRIGRFPQGLTLGDGLLLMEVAACFGLVFGMFLAALIGLGIILWAPFASILRLPMLARRIGRPRFELARPSTYAVILAGLAAWLIFLLARREAEAMWRLPVVALALFPIYSIYVSSEKKLAALTNSGFWHRAPQDDRSGRAVASRELRQIRAVAPWFMAAIPLALGGVSGQLLDGAMRAAHIRIEKQVVYLKMPFRAMLPETLVVPEISAPPGYTAFSGVVTLFTGFGTSTAIQFVDRGVIRKLDVPNDQIIIESKQD